ncbi:hypothetical protein VP01_4672g1 [Puccinia sorghi]|uniref:Reverse transcriptase Ty1/copia-type domain-containing protein n=1 Tax=Puccinia sorghi TaxID=27349 RepID=A0A0L6UQ42_9BASI|nr:hypothetical protein VP01_4672g1 [Puccinia sorghi]
MLRPVLGEEDGSGVLRKIDLSFFKPIGNQVSYLILPSRSHSKLEQKGLLGTLIGFNDELLSYRILNDDGCLVNTKNLKFLDFKSSPSLVDDELLILEDDYPTSSNSPSGTKSVIEDTVPEQKSEEDKSDSNNEITSSLIPSSSRSLIILNNPNPIFAWSRLCIQGFLKIPGQEYNNTFAPTGKFTLLLIMLLFAINKKLPIRKFDVKSAFLVKANSSIYLNKEISVRTKAISFKLSTSDPCLFIHRNKKSFIFFHVDNLVVMDDVENFGTAFLKRFPNSSGHDPNTLLGMNLSYDSNCVSISKEAHCKRA